MSRHDGADTAFSTRRCSSSCVGDLDGLLVDSCAPRMQLVRLGVVDADLLVVLVRPSDVSQQLLLDLAGELQAERVVVGVLLADIARIGPRGLRAGARAGGRVTAVMGVVTPGVTQ